MGRECVNQTVNCCSPPYLSVIERGRTVCVYRHARGEIRLSREGQVGTSVPQVERSPEHVDK